MLNPTARNRIYNIVDGEADVLEYLSVVYRGVGRPVPRLSDNKPHWRFSSERVRRELGYAPSDRWHEFLVELGKAGSASGYEKKPTEVLEPPERDDRVSRVE